MIAHVVPLRRLDPGHDWFDYQIPATLNVQPGLLVQIPFQSRSVFGVVWSVADASPHQHLKAIQRLVVDQPIMTTWQMEACAIVAKMQGVSLASMVSSIVPAAWPKRVATLQAPPAISRQPVVEASSDVLWYHDRATAEQWMIQRLKQPELTVLLAPTIEDAEHLAHVANQAGQHPALVTSQLTPAQYRRIYLEILAGQVTAIVGTSRALLLPYFHPPRWLVDQSEHPAHKLRQQYPPLSVTAAVEVIGGSISQTTPAPRVEVYHRLHPAPPPTQSIHQLWSLAQPKPQAWITPDLAELIQQSGHSPVALILPFRGFAHSMVCRDCGWSLRCPNCGQTASLQKANQHQARCLVCQQLVDIPAACPRCQGTAWQYLGLGINRFAQAIHDRWPGRSVSTSWPPGVAPQVQLGTYQAYRWLPKIQNLKAVVVVSGDALRAWPDFSADERAWQYLARLNASRPDVPLVVQTHTPDDIFWQRWNHHDHRAWYEHELLTRQQLTLPPTTQLWVAKHPAHQSAAALMVLKQKLSKHPRIHLVELPSPKPSGDLKIALSAPPTVFSVIEPTRLFPLPWRVDTTADSWIQ